jgi:hypothetical protein
MMEVRKWRPEPVWSQRASGRRQIVSWRLVAGRDRERVRLPLGAMSEEDAKRCCEAMQDEERRTLGTPQYDRVLRLTERELVRVDDDE